MISENARRVLRSMHHILKGDEVFSTQTQQIALEEAMLALEVVEKIKTEIAADYNEDCLDNIYIILCESFGIGWEKEYQND